MSWQPIDTAPKDGTRFIALLAEGEVSVCHWSDDYVPHTWANNNEYRVYPTYWIQFPEGFIAKDSAGSVSGDDPNVGGVETTERI